MAKFKVGDIVVAKKNSPYRITKDGWKGRVVMVRDSTKKEVINGVYAGVGETIKVEHIEDSAPCRDWVNPDYFDKYNKDIKETAMPMTIPEIKDVIFNDPATIVIWADDVKTIVKCGENEKYDPEKGLALCIAKRTLGNRYSYYEPFKKWLGKYEKKKKATPKPETKKSPKKATKKSAIKKVAKSKK